MCPFITIPDSAYFFWNMPCTTQTTGTPEGRRVDFSRSAHTPPPSIYPLFQSVYRNTKTMSEICSKLKKKRHQNNVILVLSSYLFRLNKEGIKTTSYLCCCHTSSKLTKKVSKRRHTCVVVILVLTLNK